MKKVNNMLAPIFFIVILILITFVITCNDEDFSISAATRGPNYETGANMLRGDLPIAPVQQSWFNTPYGPQDLVKGAA